MVGRKWSRPVAERPSFARERIGALVVIPGSDNDRRVFRARLHVVIG